jgi:hypothetical protein
MNLQEDKASENSTSPDRDQKVIESKIGGPSYEIIDLLDNTWCGYMMPYDGVYGESQDIPKQELRRLTSILKQMETHVITVRSEFERRIRGGSR